MLFYPAALPLSTSTLNRVARLIRVHRKTIGSRWRVPDPGTQALLTLAYLRKGERLRADPSSLLERGVKALSEYVVRADADREQHHRSAYPTAIDAARQMRPVA